jgi:protein MpaA
VRSTHTALRIAAGIAVLFGLGGCAHDAGRGATPPTRSRVPTTRASSLETATSSTLPLGPRTIVIGTSAQGRVIRATEIGNPNASFKVVIVGCIHGDEPAGIAIARRLEQQRPDRAVDLWVIDDLNPDGVAADSRQNAHGVDLNRNFPYEWQPIGRLGDVQYSGTHPLSEPEARAAVAFLDRVRPSVTIWFHQHADLVDNSGGDPAVEEQFADETDLPFQQLTRYPGSAAGWENHHFAGSTAFVVELPAGPAGTALTNRTLDAIREVRTRQST